MDSVLDRQRLEDMREAESTLKAHGFDDKAAIEIAALHRADELAQQVGRLQRELDQMRAEYLGRGQKPQAGCRFATVSLDDADTLVEYEFQPEEAPNYDVESRGVGPGCPASVTVIQALINGRWIDPRDVLREEIVERWEEQLLEDAE